MSMMLLTPAAIVDNLAEKVDECPLNQGGTVMCTVCVQLGVQINYILYGIVGRLLFKGFLVY